jgi:hypothetical protein
MKEMWFFIPFYNRRAFDDNISARSGIAQANTAGTYGEHSRRRGGDKFTLLLLVLLSNLLLRSERR